MRLFASRRRLDAGRCTSWRRLPDIAVNGDGTRCCSGSVDDRTVDDTWCSDTAAGFLGNGTCCANGILGRVVDGTWRNSIDVGRFGIDLRAGVKAARAVVEPSRH